jgi:hypothetical protein
VSEKVFDIAVMLYACSDASLHDANEIRILVARLEEERDTIVRENERLRAIEAAARQIEHDGMYVTLPILAKHWDELRAALAAKENDK